MLPKIGHPSPAQDLAFVHSAEKQFRSVSRAEALCSHAEARTGVLKGSTVRNYKHRYRTAIEWIAAEDGLSPSDREACQRRIDDALERLRGKPEQPRTASKKVKDAKAWMVKAVFGHLQLAAVKYQRLGLAATALYCLVKPRLGTRPVELNTATIEGDVLVIRNAKTAGESYRRLDLSEWTPSHRMALAVLIELARAEIESDGYDAWLSRLAENLARACEAASRDGEHVPRLAPSSFRHTAISTWHAAGFTVDEIAEMAGHVLTSSASRHYIHKSAAWATRREQMVRPVAVVEPAMADELLLLDDFPVPAPKAEKAKEPIDWRGHLERSLRVQVPAPARSDRMVVTDEQTADLPQSHCGSGSRAKPK